MADPYTPNNNRIQARARKNARFPLPVIGMTEREYRAAFTYLDYANFTREVGEIGEKRRRATVLEIPRTAWYKRPECWAIIMGSISLMHGLFVQWVWPQIQTTLPANPPKAPRPLPAHPSTTRRWA